MNLHNDYYWQLVDTSAIVERLYRGRKAGTKLLHQTDKLTILTIAHVNELFFYGKLTTYIQSMQNESIDIM